MNRSAVLVVLAIAAVVGLVFGLYPELDLKIAGLFFDPNRESSWVGLAVPYSHLRTAASWLTALIAAPAFLACAVKLLCPRCPPLLRGRAVMLMLTTLALAPGLVTNGIFKDLWGRPRPIDVTVFNGTDQFVPWWDPRGACPKNCSFVAGEPSGAFWTLAPAVIAPPTWRAVAIGATVAFGTAVGVLRMAAGGHFFSDVVFSGVFTYLIIWLVHGLIYRWRRTRTTDEAVEAAVGSFTAPLQRAAAWVAGRISRADAP